jgi:hypothetical protein
MYNIHYYMSTGLFRATFLSMPKKGPLKYSELIAIRLEPELRVELDKWAEEEDRSTGSLIRVILRQAMEAREGKKPKKKPA